MTENSEYQSALLRKILSAIEADLSRAGADDIASFIDAGEYGLAADTIFCAISEEAIALDDETLRDFNGIAGLFNTFGDLNGGIATAVLRQPPRSAPAMR